MEFIKSTQTDVSPLDRASYLVGGRGALALMLGVSVAAIGNWKARGVPIEHCVPIEKLTGGVVGRRELRATDYLEIWPELAVPEPVKSVDISIKTSAGAPLTTDPALEAELAKAEQAGLVLLPKKAPVWDGIERRQTVRRVVDRACADIGIIGQGV